jgi:hypothetical protein
MNSVLGLAKWLLIIPTIVFASFHFMSAGDLAGMAPGGIGMVYFTGLCLLLAAIGMIIGKYDKLAASLLGILFLLFTIPHLQMMADDPSQMGQIMKNVGMAAGAFLFAKYEAKDNSVIG